MTLFSKLNPDIITFHILPNLDGKTLIILSYVSSQFHNLIWKNNNSDLRRKVCISTWPSLLTTFPKDDFLSIISMFPGGYRSFFSDAFPSILSPPLNNNTLSPPPPPPMVFFSYAVDIFLEPEPKPFCSVQSYQLIFTKECEPHPMIQPFPFRCPLYHSKANFKFITVKKEGYEEYLKQRLRFSCVVVNYDGNRVGSLFNGKPVSVRLKNLAGTIGKAVYETVLPGPGPRPYLYDSYTEMVKCRVNVNFEWEDEGEDRFHVVKAYLKMKDMNRKLVWERHGAIVLLNAIGGRKRGEEEENAQ